MTTAIHSSTTTSSSKPSPTSTTMSKLRTPPTTATTTKSTRFCCFFSISYISVLELCIVGMTIFLLLLHNTLIISSSSSNQQHPQEQEQYYDSPPLLSSSSTPIVVDVNPKLPITTKNLNSTSLPPWMIEHIQWHQKQRSKFLTSKEDFFSSWKNNANNNSTTTIMKQQQPKFLILQCTSSNGKCGGLSDRLKPLPLLILGAYQSKRILLIRWKDKPTKLENFLLPIPTTTDDDDDPNSNSFVFDWRVPDWLEKEYLDNDNNNNIKRKHIYNVLPFMKKLLESSDIPIISTTLQWWDGGEQAYKDYLKLDNKHKDEFRRIYHDLFFNVLFVPTQPIQDILSNIYHTTKLKSPQQYTVAHYRANWWEQNDPPTQKEIDDVAINSIKCANQLQPKLPIYFATDNKDAQKSILNYIIASTNNNNNNNNTPKPNIVVIPHKELIHLDRTPSNTSLDQLYPIFVDLLLLANGNCMSYGDGGFGKFGLMISPNYDCYKKHIHRHKIQNCDWADYDKQ